MAFKEALKIAPEDHDAHFSLGNVYSNMRRWADAISEYQQAIRASKKDGEAYNNLGLAHFNLGAYAEAVKAYEHAIRIFPNWAEPHFNLGNAHSKLGRPGAALAEYKVAVQLRPDYASSVPPAAGGPQPNLIARNNSGAARENNGESREDSVRPSPASTQTSQRTASNNNTATNDASPSSSPTSNSSTGGALPKAPDPTPARNASITETPAPKTVAPSASVATNNTTPVDPTSIYRVGIGDVLDIRLLNAPTNSSTLYTVQAGGLLEYALAGDSIVVVGLTTDEIDARLTSELQRRSIQANPQVIVSVRDYASHTVLVSGLVGNPGGKILQREAVPLYVIVADAQPRPEAAQVVLNSHTTGQNTVIDLTDTAGLNTLVRPGDVINVTAQTPQFYYIGGDIDVPGQKEFHAGITLTQAVLAAGGYLRAGKTVVEIARQGADGRLNALKYKLVDIMSGKIPDPRLQGGDRIEVYR
ncbi:MAG: tetratricopeptide repeat protein [Pyrinomonadaceae bacterium]|nr:tetratricopeptide repeat protein [Pyrinomonadaceae bacterium]